MGAEMEAEKIDRLIDYIDGMVVTGEGRTGTSDEFDFSDNSGFTEKLAEGLKEITMEIRKVPLSGLFAKYEQFVRDLSIKKNKRIKLLTKGASTELDKSLVEKVSPLLTKCVLYLAGDSPHLIRKESSQGRNGTIIMTAGNENGTVCIEVLNDAVDFTGEIKAGVYDFEVTDNNNESGGFYELLTSLRRTMEALGGSVTLENRVGASFKICLPESTSIINGITVRAGPLYFIFPYGAVLEYIDVPAEVLKDNFAVSGNEKIPFMVLSDFLDLEREKSRTKTVVVTSLENKKTGFVVDECLGEYQAVVKPVGHRSYNRLWLGGATVLRDGETAFILDVGRLHRNVR